MSLSKLQFGHLSTSAVGVSLMDREKTKRQYTLELAENEKKILNALNQQRKQDGAKCEVVLVANGKKYFAHKIVLESCSEYLRQRLSEEDDILSTSNDSKTKTHKDGEVPTVVGNRPQTSIILPGITPEELDAVLEFMYTSRIVLEPGNVNEILFIGCLLQVQSIIELCASVLLKHPSWRSSLVTPEIAKYGKREWESKNLPRKHGKSTSPPTNVRGPMYDTVSKSGLTIPYLLEAPLKNENFKRGTACVEKKCDGKNPKARFVSYQGDQWKGDSDVTIVTRVSDFARRRTSPCHSTDSAGAGQRGGKRQKLRGRDSAGAIEERNRTESNLNRGPPSLIPHSQLDSFRSRTQHEVLDLRRQRYGQNHTGYGDDDKRKLTSSETAFTSNAKDMMLQMLSAVPSELYKNRKNVYGDPETIPSYTMGDLTHPALATNFALASEIYNRKQQVRAAIPQVGIDTYSFVCDYPRVVGIPSQSGTSNTNYPFLLPTYSSPITCQDSLIADFPRHGKGGRTSPARVKRHSSQNRRDFMAAQTNFVSEDFRSPIAANSWRTARKSALHRGDENQKAALRKSIDAIREGTEKPERDVDLMKSIQKMSDKRTYVPLARPVCTAPLTAKSEAKHEVSNADMLYNAYSDAHRRKRKLLSGTHSFEIPTVPQKKALMTCSIKHCPDQNREYRYLSKGHKYSSEDDVIARDCLHTELSDPESEDSGRPSSV